MASTRGDSRSPEAVVTVRPSAPSISAQRLQILAAAVLFSTGGAAIKACTLTSWQVASFRSAVAALLLVSVAVNRGSWSLATLGVGSAYAATMILFVSANKLTTAANTIFLQSTASIYMLLLGPWLLGEPVRRRDLPFVLSLAVGMVLFFVGHEAPQATAPAPRAGNLLAAASALTWALTILGLRWLARSLPAGAGSAVVAGNVIACLVALPLALPVTGGTARDWALIVYLGVFQIGLAYLFLTRAVRVVPALEVALLLLLEPVLNALWAWCAHGERPGGFALAGCTLILATTVARALQRDA